MEPTLRAGDRLLVDYAAAPRAGRLAVVRLPNRPLAVKRLARVTDGGWWVAADNHRAGVDSRVVGVVAAADVVALVLLRVWPRPRFAFPG